MGSFIYFIQSLLPFFFKKTFHCIEIKWNFRNNIAILLRNSFVCLPMIGRPSMAAIFIVFFGFLSFVLFYSFIFYGGSFDITSRAEDKRQ